MFAAGGTAAGALTLRGSVGSSAARQAGVYLRPEAAMRRRIGVSAVMGRVKQQDKRDRRECGRGEENT